MTTEPTNTERAAWAKEALTVFTARTFNGEHPDSMERDDLQCAIHDLITNLLHYASQEDFDTGHVLYLAVSHFDAEQAQEIRP